MDDSGKSYMYNPEKFNLNHLKVSPSIYIVGGFYPAFIPSVCALFPIPKLEVDFCCVVFRKAICRLESMNRLGTTWNWRKANRTEVNARTQNFVSLKTLCFPLFRSVVLFRFFFFLLFSLFLNSLGYFCVWMNNFFQHFY